MLYSRISLWCETFNFHGSRQETNTLNFRIEARGFYKLSCYQDIWVGHICCFQNGFPQKWMPGKRVKFVRLHFSCPCCLCSCHFKKPVGFRNEMICLRLWKLAERVAFQMLRWPHHPARASGGRRGASSPA